MSSIMLKTISRIENYIFRDCKKLNFGKNRKYFQIDAQSLKLCSEKKDNKTKQNFIDLFHNVNSYYLFNGYVNPELLSKLTDSLQNITLSREQSNFLLESVNFLFTITKEERMKIFNKLWNYFKYNNDVNEEKVIKALNFFQKNNIDLNDAQLILNDFTEINKNLNFYEELVRLICENGEIHKATTIVLEEMKKKKLPLTDRVFSSLIIGHSKNMNIIQCEAVIDTMNAANLKPSTGTLCELLRAYLENGFIQKAEKLLFNISNKLSTNQILMLIRSSSLANLNEITRILVEILPDEFKLEYDLPGTLKGICVDLLYCNQIDAAFIILDSFSLTNFREIQDIDKFGQFFITEMIKSKVYSVENCINICKKLIQSKKNVRALHLACEINLRKFPEKAIFYIRALSELEDLRPHYFWPLLNYEFKTKGEMGILKVIKFMFSLSVNCDFEILHNHCFPRLSIIIQNIDEATAYFENIGLKSSIFLTPLVSHLIILQKPKDINKICKLYPTKINTSRLVRPLASYVRNQRNIKHSQFIPLLKLLISKSEDKLYDLTGQILLELAPKIKINNLCKILDEFQNQKITVSKNSVELLQSQFCQLDKLEDFQIISKYLKNITNNEFSTKSPEAWGSQMVHPRNMSLADLECHLLELESKNLNTRGVLRRLLQLYIRGLHLEKALKIKEKCEKLNLQFSPGMMACVLDLYIKLKNVEMAEQIFKNMKKQYPGFLIDEHKIIDLATLMVEKNKMDLAKDLILERSCITKTTGGDYIYRNLWNLLSQIAQFSAREYPDNETNLTKEFFNMLRKYKFCQPENILLGPIIREYLLKNKIKEAIDEFVFITNKFKKTPLQLELMSILINISNNKDKFTNFNISEEEAKSYLQIVVTCCSKIHGSINCNGSLLLAVSESGSETQLRKLLLNPEFRINIDSVTKNIEHMSSNGRIESILKLAKACRGLKHVLNEQELYRMLLNEFAMKNNYKGALELFDTLEADDEMKMSEIFLKKLVDLLKANNIEIPSNIALRSHLKC